MILTLQRALGTLSAAANTIVMTIDGNAGDYTVDVYATFSNTGATDRMIALKMGGVYVFLGDSTNSPLKAGQTLEVHVRHKILYGETIQAWQSAGADVDYFITAGVLPA